MLQARGLIRLLPVVALVAVSCASRTLPVRSRPATPVATSAPGATPPTPTPSPSPTAAALPKEVFEGEVKAARSYLEGWFGATITMPPIEVLKSGDLSPELPGHYEEGVIRLRAETTQKQSELRRVLRHELTHAVIDQRTRGNCPHWLQEGMAQFLDGTDVVSTEKLLRRDGAPLLPLFRIEGPFKDRDEATRERSYRESASAVSFLISRIGRSGILFLIQRLGQGRQLDQALVETGLSYTELQQAWESSIRPLPRPNQPPI